MLTAFELKEKKRIEEEERIRRQEEKYMMYMKELDSREEAVKVAK